ncbi:MAG: hypothetical protein E8D46_13840 [Nitrospira sp.]|nr:MAG: hypothetical protein E8D46_13840 [Nitrospira sp.]
MKRDLLRSVVLVLAFSANVYAGECNLEIRDSSVAQDLNRALLCFDQRLKNLEVKSSDPEQRLGIGIPTRNPATFNAGTFTVSARAASSQGDRLYIGMQVYNQTAEQIFLALNQSSPSGGQILIGEDTGHAIRLGGSNGFIEGIASQWITNNGYSKEEIDYTPIPPNTILNFTLQFVSGNITSNTLGLTLQLYSLKNRQVQRITAPLSVTLKDK